MIVHPIHVREGECVDIHWHTAKDIYIERHTCPPKATREYRDDAKLLVDLSESKYDPIFKEKPDEQS